MPLLTATIKNIEAVNAFQVNKISQITCTKNFLKKHDGNPIRMINFKTFWRC